MKTTITDLTHDGRGVGKIDGKTVFVENVYPTEEVEIEITKDKKKFLEGKPLEVLKESKDRIDSICPDFYRCNGCQFCDYEYLAQIEFKKNRVINDFKKFAHIDLYDLKIHPMEDFYNYRNHVQLRVKNGEIGYIDKEVKKVFTPENCVIAPKTTQDLINILKDYPNLNKINLVGIRENYKNEIMLILVTNDKDPLDISSLVEKLKDLKVTHIHQNINNNPRSHYGKEYIKLWGEGEFFEEILGNKFILSPTSFFQVNRTQTEKLYKKAIENLNLNFEDKVLELYSGIGTITMELGKLSKKVLGIEDSKTSVKDAKTNSKLNNLRNVKFLSGRVEENLENIDGYFTKVILDPPRSGANKIVLDKIINLKPEVISYISCNPATLARDVEILVNEGNYKLEDIEVFDMFPLSSHVECVVLMSRVEKYD